MGFDLYSLGNHKNKNGEYFRNNVWWWRPSLTSFAKKQTALKKLTKSWRDNDGHEVNEALAKQIANQLKALIKNGEVSKAIKENEEMQEQANHNNKFVERCHKMLAKKVEKNKVRQTLHLLTIRKKITTLGIGYNLNIVMVVPTLSQWKT